ncbi:MAG TPA: hypothetical protein VF389_06080 [Woeseiaceae bacterium]
MTVQNKEALKSWLPSITAIAACVLTLALNFFGMSRWVGTVDSRLGAVEKAHVPVERLYELFTPRAEWTQQIVARNSELNDLKVMVRESNGKIDQLYQLQLRNLSKQ